MSVLFVGQKEHFLNLNFTSSSFYYSFFAWESAFFAWNNAKDAILQGHKGLQTTMQAALLQSLNVAHDDDDDVYFRSRRRPKFGVSGTFWYAAFQTILFAIFAIEIMRLPGEATR